MDDYRFNGPASCANGERSAAIVASKCDPSLPSRACSAMASRQRTDIYSSARLLDTSDGSIGISSATSILFIEKAGSVAELPDYQQTADLNILPET